MSILIKKVLRDKRMIALFYHHLLREVYVLQTFMMMKISPEPSATIEEYSQRFVSAKDYTSCC